MIEHMSGSWHIEDDRGRIFIHTEGVGNIVAQVDRLSNARLIAAAPDLLAACELLMSVKHDLEMVDENGPGIRAYSFVLNPDEFAQLQAAIKSARGES